MAFDLQSLVRPNIWALLPYRCARDDFDKGILLDANENCYGSAVQADPFIALERYPDPYQLELKVIILLSSSSFSSSSSSSSSTLFLA